MSIILTFGFLLNAVNAEKAQRAAEIILIIVHYSLSSEAHFTTLKLISNPITISVMLFSFITPPWTSAPPLRPLRLKNLCQNKNIPNQTPQVHLSRLL
jgi:hypothetical protein